MFPVVVLCCFFVAKRKVTPNLPATTGSSNLDPKGLPEMAKVEPVGG